MAQSFPTSAQVHPHAASGCNLAGCRIADDWQPFPDNTGCAYLAVHGCFTVTRLSAEASPGTARAQNVCLRYCQTWQPGAGYWVLKPLWMKNITETKHCGPCSLISLDSLPLAKKMLVGGKGPHLSYLFNLSDVFPVIKCAVTSEPNWMPCRQTSHARLSPGMKLPEPNVWQDIRGTGSKKVTGWL